MKTVEYRVRPVTRYIVTRFSDEVNGEARSGISQELGEFNNEEGARRACNGMFFAEKSMPHDLGTKFLLDGEESAIGVSFGGPISIGVTDALAAGLSSKMREEVSRMVDQRLAVQRRPSGMLK